MPGRGARKSQTSGNRLRLTRAKIQAATTGRVNSAVKEHASVPDMKRVQPIFGDYVNGRRKCTSPVDHRR